MSLSKRSAISLGFRSVVNEVWKFVNMPLLDSRSCLNLYQNLILIIRLFACSNTHKHLFNKNATIKKKRKEKENNILFLPEARRGEMIDKI